MWTDIWPVTVLGTSFCNNMVVHRVLVEPRTVQPAHVVTSIKQSPVIKGHFSPVIENFIWIEPLLRGHLSYKATLSLAQRWSLNTGLNAISESLQAARAQNFLVCVFCSYSFQNYPIWLDVFGVRTFFLLLWSLDFCISFV